jgi:hypothetical protein
MLLGALLWCVGFSVYAATVGVPTKRGNVLIWVALAVVALGAPAPRRTARSFVTTWLPIFAALGAYDLLRGASDGLYQRAHVNPQLAFDKFVGFGMAPSERLQSWGYVPGQHHIWDFATWLVYLSHFLAPLLVAVILWASGSSRTRLYALSVVMMSWLALATYAAFPAEPPWMSVPHDGGHVVRVVHAMWSDVGVHRAANVFAADHQAASKYSNPVAALPSLHAAFPMVMFMVLRGIRRWLDVVLVVYILAMGTALVYSGEHFVFDVVLGWIDAVVVCTLLSRILVRVPRRSAVSAQMATR